MTEPTDEVWGIIPARGGSKSIPYKNLTHVAGVPLIDYVAAAGRASRTLSRLICSTEDARIAEHVRRLGIDLDMRPAELAGDDALVTDVVRDILRRADVLPEIVVLLQPTSPFVLPEHIDSLVNALRADPMAGSAQTVISCPHNAHAVNQRLLQEGRVTFVFEAERLAAYNKQRKAKHYLFGNLLATRTRNLVETNNLFATPSIGVAIPRIFGFDLDDAEDLAVANAIIASGLVKLPASQHKHQQET